MTDRTKKPAADQTRRKLILGAGGAAATAATSPFSDQHRSRAGQAPIKIGFPAPLTGPFGTEAQDQVRCAEIAVKEFNEAGGLNGRMAELLVRDDKLNPGEAATRTLELIEKDKVNFVVGALSAAVQLSVNNVCKERGVIYNSISQSDAINEVKDFSHYTFHEALNPHMTSGAVGALRLPKFGKKVAFLTRRLRLRPRDGARLPARRQGVRHARRSPTSAIRSAPATSRLLAAHPVAEARHPVHHAISAATSQSR